MTRLTKPVHRVTSTSLDGSFGPDRDRRIVITLVPGRDGIADLLQLRPERTRRPETVSVADVYRYALRCRINKTVLDKAREKKARKALRLASERQTRAEKRLLRPIGGQK